jgi:DNA processing protein
MSLQTHDMTYESAVDHDSPFGHAPILPKAEMWAYEALWLNDKAWFGKLADLFREHPGQVPSQLVTDDRIERARREIEELLGPAIRQIGIRVHRAGEYPAKLRDAAHPVEVLYFRGNWELVETPSVAIVGTRTPTPEGIHSTARIAKALVREGYTVVSGLARGVDTVAHETTLAAGGRTIAVIGTPLSTAYPRENAALQERIATEQLLISQVPFLRYQRQNYKMNRLFFPERNITMSALTEATIIIEAGNTSGTLIQARAAINQGRKLFILDSCFRNPSLTWPARFEEQGAIRVRTVSQILEVLHGRSSQPN